jgi:hypothetical protein
MFTLDQRENRRTRGFFDERDGADEKKHCALGKLRRQVRGQKKAVGRICRVEGVFRVARAVALDKGQGHRLVVPHKQGSVDTRILQFLRRSCRRENPSMSSPQTMSVR